jgi:uncharacterized protein YndB with AHSA1/START domain
MMTNARTASAENLADREIVITRVFDARRELIRNACTDPKQIVQWWGPRGFTITIHEMAVRPGGVWKNTMRGPDGIDYPNQSVFIESRNLSESSTPWRGARRVIEARNFRRRGLSRRTATRPRSRYECSSHRPRYANTSPDVWSIEGGSQTLDRLGEHLSKSSAG